MPEFFDAPQESHPERLWPLNNGCKGVTLDLGCGPNKTAPKFIGVDVKEGADVKASLDELPFGDETVDCIVSRHSLEHVLDPVKALKEWLRVLRPGGRIYVVLPDHEFINTIDPFYSNGEHLHAYTRHSFRNLLDLIPDLLVFKIETVVPAWSFGAVLRKGIPKIHVVLPHLSEVDGVKLEHREEGLDRVLVSINAQNYDQECINVDVIDGPGTVPQKVKQSFQSIQMDSWVFLPEYVIYAANDVEFHPDAFKAAIFDSETLGKALVSFNSGPVLPDEGNVNEHFLIRRDFVCKLENGEIFITEFHHVGVDNWLWAQASKMGQAFHSEQAKLSHHHFSKGAEYDTVYRKGWEHAEKDRELLKKKLATL